MPAHCCSDARGSGRMGSDDSTGVRLEKDKGMPGFFCVNRWPAALTLFMQPASALIR